MNSGHHLGQHLGDPTAELWGLVLAFRRGERPDLRGLTERERRVLDDIADRRHQFGGTQPAEDRRERKRA